MFRAVFPLERFFLSNSRAIHHILRYDINWRLTFAFRCNRVPRMPMVGTFKRIYGLTNCSNGLKMSRLISRCQKTRQIALSWLRSLRSRVYKQNETFLRSFLYTLFYITSSLCWFLQSSSSSLSSSILFKVWFHSWFLICAALVIFADMLTKLQKNIVLNCLNCLNH